LLFSDVTPAPNTEPLAAQVAALTAQVEALTKVVQRIGPLVDLKTAAQHMGVSTRTLRRMVEAETIPYRRFGRTLRFPLAALGPAAKL
jgi:excisionase family DNA binding protein